MKLKILSKLTDNLQHLHQQPGKMYPALSSPTTKDVEAF